MASSTTGFVRHRRSKRAIATFSVFEADLLRSLAAQLVELLHNESAVLKTERDPLEALLDFSGPTTEPEDPVLRRLFPNAYRDDGYRFHDVMHLTFAALLGWSPVLRSLLRKMEKLKRRALYW